RAAAAVHRGVAAAEHDDALADAIDVPERDAGQPVDTDVNVLCRFLAARNVQIAAARCAAADEDGVVAFAFVEQCFQTVDANAPAKLDAEIEDVAHFLVDHGLRQPELGDLAADHPSSLRVAVVDDALVTERSQISGNSQRSRPGADERD